MHILCAHLRQLHLTKYLLRDKLSIHDVFFVDQLSTCVPFLRAYARRRVLFYVHFPDKLLADGQFEGIMVKRKRGGLLKKIYRMPMDWLEEKTTGEYIIISDIYIILNGGYYRLCGLAPCKFTLYVTSLRDFLLNPPFPPHCLSGNKHFCLCSPF